MSRRRGGAWPQQQTPARLPADHVLFSGAVLFPGAFDQLGCPLVVFPVDGKTSLSTALSKAEVVDFINYCLSQHNKTQKSSLVSVVADLREASASSTRFIAETLLLLEQQERTVHSAYIIQPKRKDVLRLLGKLWDPSKLQPSTFKKVFLKEVFELSNYIDRSQLMASLGGYLVYHHQSWAVFTKEMAAFQEHFASVVQRLPGCLSTLQALSRLPLPNSVPELHLFCSSNEARFQQLQRALGLDDVLRHCKLLLEKLRLPDLDPHFQAMAGTALFTLQFSSMLQNHRRITAAVQKVELLWNEFFSNAQLQLHVLQMREAALQITEQIESLLQHKLQPYNIQIAGDATEAERLTSEFHSSVYTPAMSLVAAATEVVRTLTELLCDAPSRERWLLDLCRLKEKLHSTVTLTLQTLHAVSKYHRFYNKAHSWYKLVLSETFLQDMFSEVERPKRNWGTLPTWKKRLSVFLKNNPPTQMEELVHLAHLSQVIPDELLQQKGRQLSHRCMTLRQMVMSSEPLTVAQLQVPLQWQYELLQSSLVKQREHATNSQSAPCTQEVIPRTATQRVDLLRPGVMAEGKLSSPSSFDSGFEGAGTSMLEGHTVTLDFAKQTLNQPQIQEEETVSNLSDSGGFGSLGNSSRASVHIVPKTIHNSLDFEIKVKRSAAHPTNPWLSLPDDDLENLYTVTITPKLSEQKGSCTISSSHKNEELCPETPAAPPTTWALPSHCSLEDSELNPITHVLSSTVTETQDQATGVPSMLWDSYDLHEQYLDASESVITPAKDWDIKEEENLIEVEKTLERADKILTEEECVLAQEVKLNVLLRTEVGPDPWMAWNNQKSLDELSTNVVDLDQLGAESKFDTDFGAQPGAWRSKPDLLTELKEAHALDQKILEENFKIHLLRQEIRPEEIVQRNSDMLNEENVKMQIAKEKFEQDNLERLPVRICQVKKHKGRATRVIRCSIMSTTEGEEDRAICNELLSGQSNSEGSHSLEDFRHSCSSDPLLPKAVPRTSFYNETDIKLQNDTGHPPNDPPVSNMTVASINSVQPSSDGAVADNALGASNPRPIPKPRINLFSLNEDKEQHGTQTTDYGSAPPVDSVNAFAHSVNIEKVSAPTIDTVKLIVAAATDATDSVGSGGLPGGDGGGLPGGDGGGLPGGDGGGLPGGDGGGLPGGDGGGLPGGDGGGSPGGDSGGGIKEDKSLFLSPSVALHTNNNNNNNNNCLQPEDGKGETPSTDKDPDQQMEDFSTAAPHLCDTHVSGPPTSALSYNLETGDLMWSEEKKLPAPMMQDQFNINTTLPSDFGPSIILDTGSGLMKAGFADEDLPSVSFPTIIGVPKYEEIMNGSSEKDTYVGHEAQHMRGVLALRHPIKHGVIRNWDDMERIWQHTFDLLRVNPGEHPVLLTEAPMNPLENRQRAMEIMFEFFGVPYCYVAMQAVLALYAAGRTTGLVLDSGDGVTHSVPVYDGYVLPHAVQRFPLAGADVTAHLTKLLQEQGVCMRTTAEQEIVREMKEKCCCVALNYEVELCEGASCGEASYTLPDGKMVTLGSERIRAPEILFKPEVIGRDHYGLHESMYKSILSSDVDLRRDFLGNIILSGGNTLLPGLPERLRAELSALVPCDSSVRVSSPSDRDFSVWCGGAVLANLPSFCRLWISQSEYEEYGPQIVHRKCF